MPEAPNEQLEMCNFILLPEDSDVPAVLQMYDNTSSYNNSLYQSELDFS